MSPNSLELLEGIKTWVEHESHSGAPEHVNRLMDLVSQEWVAAGAAVERIAGTGGYGDHLRITSPWGAADDKGVLVLCHLDTVHPIGTLANALPFRVEGDAAYGPGIYDMKGGAYLALQAYRDIVAEAGRTHLPLRFLFTSDEEVGSLTSQPLIVAEAARAKYVLVTEPARDGGKIVTARKGVGIFNIETEGRPAHAGSRHEDGRSAILEMARQIVRIEGMTDYERGVTFNVGQIVGGTGRNVVPQHCKALIDMRAATLADAHAFAEVILNLEPFDPDVSVRVTGAINRAPYEKSEAGARLLAHARQLAAEIGFTLEDMSTGGASDGNFVADKVATLDGLGVDGAGAHTLDEHLYVSSLEPRLQLQTRLMQTLQ
ncbi:MAG: M20 family metallopeptidase [Hyphomicrobiaceae bacterium]